MRSPEGAEREDTERVRASDDLARDGETSAERDDAASETAGEALGLGEPGAVVPEPEPATAPLPAAPSPEPTYALMASELTAEPQSAPLPISPSGAPDLGPAPEADTAPLLVASPSETLTTPTAGASLFESEAASLPDVSVTEPATLRQPATPTDDPATARVAAAEPATVPLPIVAGWDVAPTRPTPAQRRTGSPAFGGGLPGYPAPLPGTRATRGHLAAPRKRIIVLCAVLALIGVVAGFWSGFQLTPPSGALANQRADVQVTRGETTSELAITLRHLGLIRDTRVFTLYANVRGLDAHVAPGIYHLSASMGVIGLVGRLTQGQPDAQMVTIPSGLRVSQYPAYLAPLLPRFQSGDFLRIAQTGALPDGTTLTSRYWYVPPPAPHVAFALEGYLAPGSYQIPASAGAQQVVEQLLARLGEQLCPGPDPARLDAYLANEAACVAHAAPLNTGLPAPSLLAALQARLSVADARTALYDGLTIASLVARAAPLPQDAPGIASVYVNRYHAAATDGSDPSGDNVQQLDAPASAQYARDTDLPPASGTWWAPLSAEPARVDPSSPYNSSAPGHVGLIPGPIAASSWQDLAAVAAASSPNYYFSTACGATFYATSAAEEMGVRVKVRFVTAAGCPANQLSYPSKDVSETATGGELPNARLLPPRTLAPPPAIGASYAYLMNPLTGQVLFDQGANGEHPMASTTKLMTALVAVTYGQLNQRITVGQDINALAGTGASVAGLQPGETFTLRELLYALLLPSGDDAGIVIADGIAGSQAGFVWLMNDEARLLGLTHTHYANPHGLDEYGHYTSAADLAWLATIDLQHTALADVVATESLTLPATADHPQFYWVNTNELLWPPAYPGVIGIKTGYTGGAGYCLVFAAKGPSGMLVGVLLNDSTYLGRFTDARALLDWGFAAEARAR